MPSWKSKVAEEGVKSVNMACSKATMLSITLQEDELCCPVCCEEFEEPKALPQCLHNICKECLKTIVSRSGNQLIECPLCRVKSELTESGVDRLPTNHLMKRLVDGIPGRKERQVLENTIKDCQEKISSCKSNATQMNSAVLRNLEEAGQRAQRVKQEICDHAKHFMDIIQEHSRKLCLIVDKNLEEISCLKTKLEQSNQNLNCLVRGAEDYLEKATAFVKQLDRQEVIDKKEALDFEIRNIIKDMCCRIGDASSLVGAPKEMNFIKMNENADGEELLGTLQQTAETLQTPSLHTDQSMATHQPTHLHQINQTIYARQAIYLRNPQCSQYFPTASQPAGQEGIMGLMPRNLPASSGYFTGYQLSSS